MKIYIENGETHPAIKVLQDADPAPPDYTEVIDIEGIANYGVKAIDPYIKGWYDKKCVRDKLKIAVYTKMQVTLPQHVEDPAKWANLTAVEKSIACHWFCVNKQEFQTEVKDDDRYWIVEAEKYREWTMAAKNFRLKIMEAIVFRRVLNLADAKQVLADLSQIYLDTEIDIDDITKKLKKKVRVRRMANMYLEGFTNLADDGEAAIEDFVNSEAGTPFATDGFRNLTYQFRTGHTADSVADELLKVIRSEW
jgi:hypothetical protein